MTPAGMCGVVNDALGIYFLYATLASAFVARWYAGHKVESAEGVFRVREDAPEQRIISPLPDAVNGSGDGRRFRPVAT
jgi:hypothetical protein